MDRALFRRLCSRRSTGFIVITVIYALAILQGIWLYNLWALDWRLRLLFADVGATIFVFVFSALLRNASVYDPYWSVQPPVILTLLALGRPLTGMSALLLAAVWFWGIRLTANWAYTFHGLAHQDWRYTQLREQTGALYPLVNFGGIHMVPTLIVYGCLLPGATAIVEGLPLTGVGAICLLASVAAATVQGLADLQLHRFRANGRGGFIRAGLWRYSRHPNYLGEILMWWGVALAVVLPDPTRWPLCAGALANTLLFLFISIPLADNHQARKPGFDAYRRQTRRLLPLPRR